MLSLGWKHTINIKDLLTADDESPREIERTAKAIAERLRKASPEPSDELRYIIEEFEDISAEDKRPLLLFNDTLDSLYDWADAERIWLGQK